MNSNNISYELNRSLQLINNTDYLLSSNNFQNSLNTSFPNDIKTKTNNYKINNTNLIDEKLNNLDGISTPYINNTDYTTPEAYYNNFNNKGINNYIKEYICHINSIDRDIYKYPNTFNFLVNCETNSTEEGAGIGRKFTNVLYIMINTATLPKKYYLRKKKKNNNNILIENLIKNNILPDDNTYVYDISGNKIFVIIYSIILSDGKKIINYTNFNSNHKYDLVYETIYDNSIIITYQYDFENLSIFNDKYTLLYLNDINDVNKYSTNDKVASAFSVLYSNQIGNESIYTDTLNVKKIYNTSNLGNLSKFLIKFANSYGKDLTINTKALDYNVKNINNKICSCTIDNETGNIKKDYKCICSYIRHPRYIEYQIDLMFRIGIYETEFDKRIFN